MFHAYQPEDLESDMHFELVEAVPYSKMKQFIVQEIRHKTFLLKLYSIVQILAFLFLIGTVILLIIRNRNHLLESNETYAFLIGLIFSFTLLIPIHELIHAAAFLLIGKRKIHFGANLKRFMFYAGADRQVLSRKEITWVALGPLLINLLLLLLFIMVSEPSVRVFTATLFFTHLFFISGDITIISFFERHRPMELYTFDDRSQEKTFYYKKRVTV